MQHPLKLQGEVFDKMTNEEFFHFCQANRELRIERNHLHEIYIMSPANSLSSLFNNEISFQLTLWNKQQEAGQVFDSSGGFTLPDESVFSPDAAWIAGERWEALTTEEKAHFAPLCPEFIIELKSPSDSLKALQKKMLRWIENGVQLGLLILPEEKEVYLYHASGKIDVARGFVEKVDCSPVLQGFTLDLSFMKL